MFQDKTKSDRITCNFQLSNVNDIKFYICVISGFRREVDENCALNGCAQRGEVVSYWMRDSWTLTMGPMSGPETSAWNYHYCLC